eukprot:1198512-Alexandrium_andersonii.AAC.1
MPPLRWIEAEGREKLIALSATVKANVDRAEDGLLAPAIAARRARAKARAERQCPEVFHMGTPPESRGTSPAPAPASPVIDLTGPPAQ